MGREKILKTRTHRAIAGVMSLILAYVVGSKALDNGSLLFYLGTFVLIIAGIHLIVATIKK